MWGVAKIFTSGHSKVGFDQTPPPGYGYRHKVNFNKSILWASVNLLCCVVFYLI